MKLLELFQSKFWHQLGLISLSSLLWVLSIPANGIWYLQFFGLVPVLIVLNLQTKFLHVYLKFGLFYVLFLIGSFYELFLDGKQSLALSAGLFIVPAMWSIAPALAFILEKKFSKGFFLITFPLLYVSQEVLQFYWDLSFTWTHVGLMNAENTLVRPFYKIVGVEGVALFILYCNVVFTWFVIELLRFKRGLLKPVASIISIGVILLIVNIYNEGWNQQHKKLNIFQLNPTEQEWTNCEYDLEKQVMLLSESLGKASNNTMDLIVCPESYLSDMKLRPLVVNSLQKHPAIQKLASLSKEYDCPILSGAILVQLYKANTPPTTSAKQKEPGVFYDIYNGSVFITPDGMVHWRGKIGMVPFSEHIPFQGILNIPYNLGLSEFRTFSTYGTSEYQGPYQWDEMRVAPLICYEAQMPPIVNQYKADNANIFVVLSNKWTNSTAALKRQMAFVQTLEHVSTAQTEFASGFKE